MQIIPIHPGDILLLKKPHPCGGNSFRVMRVGSQVRMVCLTCEHDMTLDRIKLEKAIRQVHPLSEEQKGNENQ
jgi:hypothetical protein